MERFCPSNSARADGTVTGMNAVGLARLYIQIKHETDISLPLSLSSKRVLEDLRMPDCQVRVKITDKNCTIFCAGHKLV
jgi:hypothetical protein